MDTEVDLLYTVEVVTVETIIEVIFMEIDLSLVQMTVRYVDGLAILPEIFKKKKSGAKDCTTRKA
jgi:hypothetical protein